MTDMTKMLHVVASRSKDLESLMANGRAQARLLCNAQLVRAGMRILDLGAGLGRLSLPLQALGCDVHAVDARTDMVAHLRAAGVHAWQCDGVPATATADSYDLVLAMHVFQHQGRDRVHALMQRISQVAPQLLFTLPTLEAYKGRIPHDYVLGEGTTERFVHCETSFMWREERVPQLISGTPFKHCARAPVQGKLWLATR